MIEVDNRERENQLRDPGRATEWSIGRLLESLSERGDLPAVMALRAGQVETWSYRQLGETALRLAAGLGDSGVAVGEAVVICGPNTASWIAVALALGAVGALTVPVDDLATGAQLAAAVADACARRVFSTDTHLAALRAVSGDKPLELFAIDHADGQDLGARSWRSLLADRQFVPPPAPSDRPACLFYTSGTTGPAKGFILSHGNIGANVRALSGEGIIGPGDRGLVPLPMHHAYPYVIGMLTSLQSGIAIVLPETLSGPHIAQAMHAGRSTLVVGVPRLYEALLDAVESRVTAGGRLARWGYSLLLALSTAAVRRLGLPLGRWLLHPIRRRIGADLRLFISGGARLDTELSWKLEALGWEVLSGYGLAETASVFTANLPRRKRLGSAGTPLGDGQVRIAEPDDSGTGEIQLRGASITAGYRNNPRANEDSFTGDGWFRTSDLGFVDRDGFLFVVGRKKEILVLGGGKKVDPEELEKAYQKSAVIAEICVLERDGRLVGLVRLNMSALQAMGTMNVEQAVRTALAEAERTLPHYQRLAGFAVTGTVLPRTRLGKLQRFLIRSLYDETRAGVAKRPAAALTEEDKAELTDPIAARVWSLIETRYAIRQPALDSHLTLDLGIDSLEWMALSLELEARTGLTFAGEDIGEVQTVRDLIRLLVRVSQQQPGEKQTWQQKIMAEQERWLQPAGPALNLLTFLVFAFNKLLMRCLFRLRVEGLGRVPASGPVILAPNHASDLDPLAVAAALSFRDLRRTYWAGDVVRLFGTRLQRFFCRVVRLYPVDERNPSSAIETAAKVLARGNLQVWFPEGWRSPDGRLQRFLPGISRLLSASPATILPVYISGTFQALPRTRHWPKLHPIRVIIGDRVTIETLEHCGEGSTDEERVAGALRAQVAMLAASIGDQV